MDLNISVAGLLDDMAALQTSVYARRAYERAARSVALLEKPLSAMSDEAIAQIPNVGRSALRVITEAATTGESATVRKAVLDRGKAGIVTWRCARGSAWWGSAPSWVTP